MVEEVGTTRDNVPSPVTRQLLVPLGPSEAIVAPLIRAMFGSVTPAGFQYEYTVNVVLFDCLAPSEYVTFAEIVYGEL
jgi:hypothetical protein